MYRILLAFDCDNYEMLSTRKVHLETRHPGVLLELFTQTLSLSCTRIPDSRRKLGVQHKPYFLYKQLGHNELFLSVLEIVGASQSPSSQMPVRGQPGKQDFLRQWSLRTIVCALGVTVTQIIEYHIQARHWAKYFTHIISFILQNKHLISAPTLKMSDARLRKFKNLDKVMHQ